MPYFVDKRGREISIEVFGDDARAEYNGELIGEVLTTGPREFDSRMADLPAEITGWNVRKDFQRAGIATEMIRLLYEDLGEMVPPEIDIGQGNKNALTSDGYLLTVACQKLGYVYPFPQDKGFDDDDE